MFDECVSKTGGNDGDRIVTQDGFDPVYIDTVYVIDNTGHPEDSLRERFNQVQKISAHSRKHACEKTPNGKPNEHHEHIYWDIQIIDYWRMT